MQDAVGDRVDLTTSSRRIHRYRSARCTTWSISAPPPERAGSTNHGARVSGIRLELTPSRQTIAPRAPDRTDDSRESIAGLNLIGKAVMRRTPARSQTATISSASATVVARGLSQRTSAPAAAASLVSSRWSAFVEAITTPSTASSRSSVVGNARVPAAFAAAPARAGSASQMPTSSTVGIFASSRM